MVYLRRALTRFGIVYRESAQYGSEGKLKIPRGIICKKGSSTLLLELKRIITDLDKFSPDFAVQSEFL